MADNYNSFRAGMLRAADMCRNEFRRAPEAAKGHDCVYMGGYEDACDHLSAVIAQAAVIDSVRIAGAQPDWQYHIALLLPEEGVEDAALLKIFQVVEHELRNALPSRDAEIREVLEGFRPREDRYAGGWCWCDKDLTNDRQPHSKHCETVNALYAKLQPGKEGNDVAVEKD